MFFFWMVKLYSLLGLLENTENPYRKLEACDTVSRVITKVSSLAHTGVHTHMLICVLVGPVSAPLLVFLSGGFENYLTLCFLKVYSFSLASRFFSVLLPSLLLSEEAFIPTLASLLGAGHTCCTA